jgi:YgiT-type zinc finger domain-containing protein
MVDRCGECGGRESRFDGINLFVEYAGARLEVANLSGWRCDACGDVRFDPESATRYADAEDRLVLEEDQLQRSEVPREAGLTQTALDAADTLGAVGAGGLRPCWICGDPADSDEHRRKRSDLVSRYGRSWKPEQQPFVIRGDGRSFWTRLQGPDDRKNLYRKMLCCACNNARTRPFDKAYQAFSNWVLAMGATLHEKEEINFVEIFGMAWEARTLDLLRYFTKCLGCQIVHAGVDVPEELRQIIYELMSFGIALTLRAESWGTTASIHGRRSLNVSASLGL